MGTTDAFACGHDACGCAVQEDGDRFCSDSCRLAAETGGPPTPCDCAHPECGPAAEGRDAR